MRMPRLISFSIYCQTLALRVLSAGVLLITDFKIGVLAGRTLIFLILSCHGLLILLEAEDTIKMEWNNTFFVDFDNS